MQVWHPKGWLKNLRNSSCLPCPPNSVFAKNVAAQKQRLSQYRTKEVEWGSVPADDFFLWRALGTNLPRTWLWYLQAWLVFVLQFLQCLLYFVCWEVDSWCLHGTFFNISNFCCEWVWPSISQCFWLTFTWFLKRLCVFRRGPFNSEHRMAVEENYLAYRERYNRCLDL